MDKVSWNILKLNIKLIINQLPLMMITCLFLQGPDLATEDEYWDLWEAVKVDDIDVVIEAKQAK